MQSSARRAISYPDPVRDDRPDIPLHIKNLVDNLDLDTPFYFGLDAALPPAAGKVIGSWYWATDTTKLYMDTGAAWIVIYPTSNVPADGSITGGAAGAGVKIAAATITHDNIAAGTIRSTEITDATITAAKLAAALKPSGGALDATEALRALGTTAGTAAAGNDARLGDARVPTAHAVTHRQGGTDETSHLAVSALPVYETGVLNQLRAGRVLALTDFTTLLGLSAPQGLWNLGDLTDISGNGRNLTNKGAVAFGLGITGNTPEAAIFTGSVAQALYIADTGAGDPFRIPYGSVGCWFKSAKTGVEQELISKYGTAAQFAYLFSVGADGTGLASFGVSTTGANRLPAVGVSNVCDNRWHFLVGTYDGTVVRVYVDGVLEGESLAASGPIFPGSSPLNIGGYGASGAVNASGPSFGPIGNAFVTQDVLLLEQVRMLYCAKIAHGYAVVPNRVALNVRRRRKGGTLGIAPFSTQPLHLYDFTAGSLADVGSLGTALTNNNAAVACPGADGSLGNAFRFNGTTQYLSATDAGLPAGAAVRTMGCWFKTGMPGFTTILMWYGTTLNTNDAYMCVLPTTGAVELRMGGTFIDSPGNYADGQWHQAVGVLDPAPSDNLQYKLYVDGKLVASSAAALVATTLGGAGAFKIGLDTVAGGHYFAGQIDAPFITGYAATADEIAKWFAQGSLDMLPSPKNPGDHIEGVDATNIYAIFDTLESQHKIDLLVSA